jgi:FMN phosphatase YigB (HAD superfamily)
MIKALITDVSKVLLFPVEDAYKGSLNSLYREKRDLTNFDFFEYFKVNEELLDIYRSLLSARPIFILTSDVIQEDSSLKAIWKNFITEIFSAFRLNTDKSKPQAYKLVLEKIGLSPEEVIYVDDNETNIKSATSVGLQTILYKNNKDTSESIKNIMQKFK